MIRRMLSRRPDTTTPHAIACRRLAPWRASLRHNKFYSIPYIEFSSENSLYASHRADNTCRGSATDRASHVEPGPGRMSSLTCS
jgi:hypothetical protein